MSIPLTLPQTRELERVFAHADSDDNGIISQRELSNALLSFSSSFSESDVQSILSGVSTTASGEILLSDLMADRRRRPSVANGIQQIFEIFDADGDGYISSQELFQVLRELGEDISPRDVKEMIKEIDTDGDGCISYQEFAKMLLQ